MIETKKFRRKPFDVDAVEVTAENMELVAEWAGGKIKEEDGRKFIDIKVIGAVNSRQTTAYVGDYVLYVGTKKFMIYTPKAFTRNFDPLKEEGKKFETTSDVTPESLAKLTEKHKPQDQRVLPVPVPKQREASDG